MFRNRYTHTGMKLHEQEYSLQHSLWEQSTGKEKNVHPQGTGKINHGTSIQWNAGKALKWVRQGWVHWSRKFSNIHYKIKKKKKLPTAYQSSSTNVEHQTKQLVYPQFAWKEGGNAGRDRRGMVGEKGREKDFTLFHSTYFRDGCHFFEMWIYSCVFCMIL